MSSCPVSSDATPLLRQFADTLCVAGVYLSDGGGRWKTLWQAPLSEFVSRYDAQSAAAVLYRKFEAAASTIDAGECLLMSIPAAAANGFGIDVTFRGAAFRACLGGLEAEFESLDEVMWWVRAALGEDYQLHTTYRGGRPMEWRLEPRAIQSRGPSLACGYAHILSLLKNRTVVTRFNTLRVLS